MTRQDAGFSLVEAVIATGLMVLVTASVFGMLNPAHGAKRCGLPHRPTQGKAWNRRRKLR